MRYKNVSRITKKFRGVEFKPGETKTVSGYINDPQMIRVSEETPEKATVKSTSKANGSSQQKTPAQPVEEVKK